MIILYGQHFFNIYLFIFKIWKNVPCHLSDVSCGRSCGKVLRCGFHKCIKTCHKVSTQEFIIFLKFNFILDCSSRIQPTIMTIYLPSLSYFVGNFMFLRFKCSSTILWTSWMNFGQKEKNSFFHSWWALWVINVIKRSFTSIG